MRAAIYVRISDDRVGAGLGVQRQEKDCQELADRNGWDVTHVFVDNDASAYDKRKKRQGWTALLRELEAGRLDAVLAWHPDRLYRQMRDLLALIDLCDRGRVKVATVTAGDIDLSTATGRALAKTVAAWNEHESEHKSERILAKYRQLAEAGEVGNGGHRPFGFEKDRRTVREDEAAVLRDLYGQVLAGRSLTSLRRELAERGVTTTTGRGWSLQSLRYNLLSGRNAGLREHRGKVVGPAVWPAIIDKESWDKARAVLLDPQRYSGDHNGARRYVLTGFLRCGLCGSKLRPNRQAALQRFACRKDARGCGSILVRYEPAEEAIVDLVLDRLETEGHLEPDRALDPSEGLLARIAHEEARLEQLVAAYADDPDGNPYELRIASTGHRRRIETLRAALATAVVTRPLRDPVAVRAAWLNGSYDLEQKRAVLNLLLERVDVAPAVRGRSYFDPARLHVIWR